MWHDQTCHGEMEKRFQQSIKPQGMLENETSSKTSSQLCHYRWIPRGRLIGWWIEERGFGTRTWLREEGFYNLNYHCRQCDREVYRSAVFKKLLNSSSQINARCCTCGIYSVFPDTSPVCLVNTRFVSKPVFISLAYFVIKIVSPRAIAFIPTTCR